MKLFSVACFVPRMECRRHLPTCPFLIPTSPICEAFAKYASNPAVRRSFNRWSDSGLKLRSIFCPPGTEKTSTRRSSHARYVLPLLDLPISISGVRDCMNEKSYIVKSSHPLVIPEPPFYVAVRGNMPRWGSKLGIIRSSSSRLGLGVHLMLRLWWCFYRGMYECAWMNEG